MHMRVLLFAASALGALALDSAGFVAPCAGLGVPRPRLGPGVCGAAGVGRGVCRGSGLAPKMQEGGEGGAEDEDRMATLIKRREELLGEKAALLKKRKRELVLDISKLERKAKETASAKRAAAKEGGGGEGLDGMNLFDMEGGSGGGTGTRRDLLSSILTGITVTLGSFGLLLVLLSPGLERLAYLSFSSLFEEGVIYLTNQVAKAINERDWETLEDITQENGRLAEKLLQPMIFWTQGNSGDPDSKWTRTLIDLTERADAGVLALQKAAQDEDPSRAAEAYLQIEGAVREYVRAVNTKVSNDLPPLSELK